MATDTTLYVFGDNHRHPREDVEERLKETIPETAEVLVIEHAEKGDERPDPPDRAALKNPCFLILALVRYRRKTRARRAADRAATGDDTTVPEEVAAERGLSVAYTDISHQHRVAQQPWYLTMGSWAAFLTLLLGWTLNFFISLLGPLLIFAMALVSQRVQYRMREKKMARDLRQLADDYSEIVFFTGDSHVDPIRDDFDGDTVTISRPHAQS